MKKIIFSFAVFITLAACNGGATITPTASSTQNDSATNTAAIQPTEAPATISAPNSAGKAIFQSRCQPCHGMEGSAKSNNAANLQVSILDSLSITQTIKNGRGTMPPFQGGIADSDIAHLAIYVLSLRK